jgi:hypothetical protein
MADIGLKAVMDITGFTAGINKYNSMVAGASSATDKNAGTMTAALAKVGTVMKAAGGIAAGGIALVVSAVTGATFATINWAEKLDSVGDVLGTTTEESAALAVAAQHIGGNVEQLSSQIAIMTRGLFDAKGEIGPTGKVLEQLGVTFQDANGKILPTTDILQAVADKLGVMPDGLEKTQLMMDVFGKSGKDMSDMMGVLANGGMEAMNQKAKDMGLSMSDDAVNGAIELNRAFKDLKMMGQGLFVTLGTELLPIIRPLIEDFSEWAMGAIPKVRDGISSVTPLFQGLVGIIKDIIGFIGNLIDGWNKLDKPTKDIAVSMVAVGTAMVILTPVIGAVTAVTSALTIKTIAQTIAQLALNVATLAWPLAAAAVLVAGYKVYEMNKKIEQGVQETKKGWEGYYDVLMEKQLDANQVADAVIAKQDEIITIYDESGTAVKILIGDVSKLTDAYGPLNLALAKSSKSYKEYIIQALRVAVANGEITQATANYILQLDEADIANAGLRNGMQLLNQSMWQMQSGTITSSSATGYWTEAMINATWATDAAKNSLTGLSGENLAYAGNAGLASSAAYAYNGAILESDAYVKAYTTSTNEYNTAQDAMIEDYIAAKSATIDFAAGLQGVGTALSAAGITGDEYDAILQDLGIQTGELSIYQAQLATDLTTVSEYFAIGGLSADQMATYLQEAKDGTLQLTAAERAYMDNAVANDSAMRASAKAAEALELANLGLEEAIHKATQAEFAKQQILLLRDAYDQGLINVSQLVAGTESILLSAGLLSDQDIITAANMRILNDAVIAGVVPTDDLGAATEYLRTHQQDPDVIQKIIEQWGKMPGTLTPATEAVDTIGKAVEALKTENLGTPQDWEQYTKVPGEAITKGLNDADPEVKASAAKLIAPVVEQIPASINAIDWAKLGKSIGTGLAEGMMASIPAVKAAAQALADAAKVGVEEPLDMESPSKVMHEIGLDVARGFAQGMLAGVGEVAAAAGVLSSAAFMSNPLTSFAGAIMGRFKMKYTGPLEERTKGLRDSLDELNKYILENQEILSPEELMAAEYKRAEIEKELAATSLELNIQKTRELELQKQLNDLAFLQAQMDFLSFLRENELSMMDILGNLQLGLDLDLPAFVDAIARALAALVAGLNADISGVPMTPGFAGGGAFAGGGKSLGGGMQVYNNQAVNIYFSATLNNGMDYETFKVGVLDVVKGALA